MGTSFIAALDEALEFNSALADGICPLFVEDDPEGADEFQSDEDRVMLVGADNNKLPFELTFGLLLPWMLSVLLRMGPTAGDGKMEGEKVAGNWIEGAVRLVLMDGTDNGITSTPPSRCPFERENDEVDDECKAAEAEAENMGVEDCSDKCGAPADSVCIVALVNDGDGRTTLSSEAGSPFDTRCGTLSRKLFVCLYPSSSRS
jgi:hypothetical protein